MESLFHCNEFGDVVDIGRTVTVDSDLYRLTKKK